MSKINVLKKDAVFKVEMRSGTVAALQSVILDLTKNKTSEELEKIKKALENPEKEMESWLENIVVLYQLLILISEEAVKAGVTYEKDSSEINPTED